MLPALAYHVTMRLSTGRVLCPSAAMRRSGTRAMYEQGDARGLVGFRFADTHVHVLLACSREVAGQFARHAERSLRARLAAEEPFEPARFTAVRDQRHLVSTFRYLLRQEERHGTRVDPFHDGSSLPDLVGARFLPAGGAWSADCPAMALGATAAQRVAAMLPRVTRRELMAELGLHGGDAFRILGGDGPHDVSDLRAAATAALGLDTLEGRGTARWLARCAAVHVVGRRLRNADLAEVLAVSPRAVRLLRASTPHLAVVRAVGLQLRMRASHRAQPFEDAPLVVVEEGWRSGRTSGSR